MVCQRRDRIVRCRVWASLALLALGGSGPGHTEEPKHLGVASCASSVCHGRVEASEKHNALMTEYSVWFRHDRHARAYEALSSPLSKRIASNLGLADASSAEVCLDCHADNVAPARRGEDFHLSDGVGCESCHGGAENWIAEHYQKDAAYADNVVLGMRDLADPFTRARVCADCHIGSEKRMVSHRIMAAGHPRLRFELATYQAVMPAHHAEDAAYRERKAAPSLVALWSAGVQVSSQRYLELLVGKHMQTAGPFPEFALFDCFSCHKALPRGETAGYPVTAGQGLGLPAFATANLRLFERVLEARSATQAPDFTAALRTLNRANGLHNGRYQQAAENLAQLLKQEQPIPADAILLKSLLSVLLDADRARGFADYISAEQYFMSLDTLVRAYDRAEFPPEKLDSLYRTFAGADTFKSWLFVREVERLAEQFPTSEHSP